MVNAPIFFQDLKEDAQCRIWQLVQAQLLRQGLVEPRKSGETEKAFKERLNAAADFHINCRNLVHYFTV